MEADINDLSDDFKGENIEITSSAKVIPDEVLGVAGDDVVSGDAPDLPTGIFDVDGADDEQEGHKMDTAWDEEKSA